MSRLPGDTAVPAGTRIPGTSVLGGAQSRLDTIGTARTIRRARRTCRVPVSSTAAALALSGNRAHVSAAAG